MRLLKLNRVAAVAALAVALLAVLIWLVPSRALLIALNGILAGAMVTVTIAYGKLAFLALFSKPYGRVEQMGLSLMMLWMALAILVSGSVYLLMTGQNPRVAYIVSSGCYMAIAAAILQVTAPDFGMGPFQGRNGKMLMAGIVAGLAAGLGVIYLQDAHSFSPTLPGL